MVSWLFDYSRIIKLEALSSQSIESSLRISDYFGFIRTKASSFYDVGLFQELCDFLEIYKSEQKTAKKAIPPERIRVKKRIFWEMMRFFRKSQAIPVSSKGDRFVYQIWRFYLNHTAFNKISKAGRFAWTDIQFIGNHKIAYEISKAGRFQFRILWYFRNHEAFLIMSKWGRLFSWIFNFFGFIRFRILISNGDRFNIQIMRLF